MELSSTILECVLVTLATRVLVATLSATTMGHAAMAPAHAIPDGGVSTALSRAVLATVCSSKLHLNLT